MKFSRNPQIHVAIVEFQLNHRIPADLTMTGDTIFFLFHVICNISEWCLKPLSPVIYLTSFVIDGTPERRRRMNSGESRPRSGCPKGSLKFGTPVPTNGCNRRDCRAHRSFIMLNLGYTDCLVARRGFQRVINGDKKLSISLPLS